MQNTDLLQMSEAQLEREVEYYQVRSFAVLLTEAETVRQNEAQELLNNKNKNKMKKYFAIIVFMVAFASTTFATPYNISTRYRHGKCKGLGKAMLQPKKNWKSYVRYR